MSKINEYIDTINKEVCPTLNFKALSSDKEEIKKALYKLTEAFKKVYGTDVITGYMPEIEEEEGFVVVPGLARSTKTGKISVVLLDLDISSSGEHYRTIFFTEHGIITQGDKNLPDNITQIIRNEYIPYSYCYTVSIPEDIHIDTRDIHPDMKKILDEIKTYK